MEDSRRHFIRTTGAAALAGSMLGIPAVAGAQGGPGGFVLAVELEIVPSELENFRAAIKENGQAAVREEPGCRQFNIASQKDEPTRILLFEVYDNAEAFAAHQATPHFKKIRCRNGQHGEVAETDRNDPDRAVRESKRLRRAVAS